jgi:hypothetical protein
MLPRRLRNLRLHLPADIDEVESIHSAGRVARDLPLPCLVVITGAVRDEGTSFHYFPAGREVACPSPEFTDPLKQELARQAGLSAAGRFGQLTLRTGNPDAIAAVGRHGRSCG